jgi:hypothetical protein
MSVYLIGEGKQRRANKRRPIVCRRLVNKKGLQITSLLERR